MSAPLPPPAPADALHVRQAKYFRAMALSASTTDVAISMLRLAVHYERLARESAKRGDGVGIAQLRRRRG